MNESATGFSSTEYVDYMPYSLALQAIAMMEQNEREKAISDFYRNEILPLFNDDLS